jgi:Protein of unknown function (DUF4232)
MALSRLHENRRARHTALLTVASAALLATAACSGGGITVTGKGPTLGPASATAGATAPVSVATASAQPPAAGTPSTAGAPSTAGSRASGGLEPATGTPAGSAPLSLPACGNKDLALDSGYGSQSDPVQYSGIVITNVGSHTCTLRGYTGAAIVIDGRTINATRSLNLYHGDKPPLTSPPLVTLAPGASAFSVLEWVLGKGSGCYPTGSGVLEATAPNTTRTVVLSKAMLMGSGGICSGFEVSPVQAGYYGLPIGVPARN